MRLHYYSKVYVYIYGTFLFILCLWNCAARLSLPLADFDSFSKCFYVDYQYSFRSHQLAVQLILNCRRHMDLGLSDVFLYLSGIINPKKWHNY